MKMRKLLLLVALFVCVLPTNHISADARQDNGLEIGDYISLGKYDGKPIIWRYVADDENGKLIFADGIVTESEFGVNDLWAGSYIRQWLNSDADNREEFLDSVYVAYKKFGLFFERGSGEQVGFLNNKHFSEEEKSLFKNVALRTILSRDYTDRATPGKEYAKLRSDYYEYIPDEYMDEYNNAAAEILPEKVFLLAPEQIIDIKKNLGDMYFDESEENFWLRTPSMGIFPQRICRIGEFGLWLWERSTNMRVGLSTAFVIPIRNCYPGCISWLAMLITKTAYAPRFI